jgi:hypothetical protein
MRNLTCIEYSLPLETFEMHLSALYHLQLMIREKVPVANEEKYVGNLSSCSTVGTYNICQYLLTDHNHKASLDTSRPTCQPCSTLLLWDKSWISSSRNRFHAASEQPFEPGFASKLSSLTNDYQIDWKWVNIDTPSCVLRMMIPHTLGISIFVSYSFLVIEPARY